MQSTVELIENCMNIINVNTSLTFLANLKSNNFYVIMPEKILYIHETSLMRIITISIITMIRTRISMNITKS